MRDRIGTSFVVAAFMLSGLLAECALMAGDPAPLRAGPAVTASAVLVLSWLWLTLAVALHVALRLVVRSLRGRSLPASSAVAALAAVALVGLGLAYASSWVLYRRSGRFGTHEALYFAASNGRMLWLYLRQAEPWTARGVGAASLGLWAAFVAALLRDVRRARPVVRLVPPVPARLWCGLTGLCVVTLGLVGSDRSHGRRGTNLRLLATRLNPAVAALTGLGESLIDETIRPCLDVRALEPIGGQPPVSPGRTPPERPSVIFLAVESLRHDVVHLRHQGVEVTPHLNALARRGLHLTRAYAQSTHSDYSDLCIGSSLYPLRTRRHHYYRADDPWPRTRVWDLLKPDGYATAVVSSQNEAWGGMDQFLRGPSLDLFYDAQAAAAPAYASGLDDGFAAEVASGALRAGKLDDAPTTDVAIAWVEAQARRGLPFFLRLNFQDSHFPYELGPDCARPFQPCAIDFPASFLDYPVEKAGVVRNAYYNALHESDRQLGRLVGALDAAGRLADTVLVVYGENGEAFHENGCVSHAGAPAEPAVHIACVIHAPDRLAPRVEDYPFELIDVAPTVFGLLGRPPHPNFQGTDALAAGRVPAAERLLFFHAENAVARADAVLLGGRWKFRHDRVTGREAFHDLASDPGEARDLSADRPALAGRLRETLATWRQGQLAYYHFPQYYQSYYPPRPPRWFPPRAVAPLLAGATPRDPASETWAAHPDRR